MKTTAGRTFSAGRMEVKSQYTYMRDPVENANARTRARSNIWPGTFRGYEAIGSNIGLKVYRVRTSLAHAPETRTIDIPVCKMADLNDDRTVIVQDEAMSTFLICGNTELCLLFSFNIAGYCL